MNVSLNVLESITIASPCSMRWEDMKGDDRVRHCRQCELDVYNLSAMTREEGEALVLSRTGRLCARMYRRSDGTVLTADCPVGLAVARQRLIRLATRVAAAAVALLTGGVLLGDWLRVGASLGEREPFSIIREWLRPVIPMPGPTRTGGFIAGDVAYPLPRAGSQNSTGGATPAPSGGANQ